MHLLDIIKLKRICLLLYQMFWLNKNIKSVKTSQHITLSDKTTTIASSIWIYKKENFNLKLSKAGI